MATIYSASIDVNKINKEKLFKGEKGTYLNVSIVVNDEEDQYGNIVAITENQTKEEREAGEGKVYLGNGKQVWSSDGNSASKQASEKPQVEEEGDTLPF